MKEHIPDTPPPLKIEYRDTEKSVFVSSERLPIDRETSDKLFHYCMEGIELGATIKNPFPARIGGMENFVQLKQAAAENNIPLYHLQSDGKYGIIR